MTSRHHWIIVRIIITRPRISPRVPFPWNHPVSPRVRVSAPIDPVRGHGLNSTKWNGCRIISKGENYPLEELQTSAYSRPPY